MADEKEKKKVKKPTALKRNQQDELKYKRNRAWKKRMHTERVKIGKAQTPEEKSSLLSSLYKVIDKGVKRGILKKNTAARIKSRHAVK